MTDGWGREERGGWTNRQTWTYTGSDAWSNAGTEEGTDNGQRHTRTDPGPMQMDRWTDRKTDACKGKQGEMDGPGRRGDGPTNGQTGTEDTGPDCRNILHIINSTPHGTGFAKIDARLLKY